MSEAQGEFYERLTEEYATRIRQLVPRYDDMTSAIVDLARLAKPARVLDIGAGTGELTTAVLEAVPTAAVTAVEPSAAMVAQARASLARFGERVSIRQVDILDFAPRTRFDAIVSNLVLHNIVIDRKRRLFASMKTWLSPGGVIVWGDLIEYEDAGLQRYFVKERIDFARAHGCPLELIEQNFRKEESDDYPMTIEAALGLLRETGFGQPDLAWCHDTFAVLHARTEG